MARCIKCGAEMEESMKFCIICGTKAEQKVTVSAIPVTSKKLKKAAISRCTTCGAEVPVTMKFCAACGTQVNHDATLAEATIDKATLNEPERKISINFKKIITPAIIAIVVIVVAIIAIKVFSPSKYERLKGEVYVIDTDGSVIVVPSGKNRSEIDGYLVNRMSSLDGTVAAILVGVESDYGSGENALYLIRDKPQIIADGVYSFRLSASGTAVVYVKEYDPYSGSYELWYYSAGKNTRLTSDLSSDGSYAISPNGKEVVFSVSDEDKLMGIVWNGKLAELGRDIIPIAVSNGAKYIYYFRNNVFYVQQGTNESSKEKLGNTADANRIFANRDFSQIVYSSSSKASICNGGSGRESLSGNISYFIAPSGTAEQTSSLFTIYGISSFKDTFYVSRDGSINFINADFETVSIAKNASNINLASDGKTLIFLKGNSIYTEDGTSNNKIAMEFVNKDVDSFIATADGSSVYYVIYDELYYQKGKWKPSTVTNYFSYGWTNPALELFGGKELFYISDDELYHSAGDKGRLVNGIEGKVRKISASMFGVAVISIEGSDAYYYYSTDGNKFELIHQNASGLKYKTNADYGIIMPVPARPDVP